MLERLIGGKGNALDGERAGGDGDDDGPRADHAAVGLALSIPTNALR